LLSYSQTIFSNPISWPLLRIIHCNWVIRFRIHMIKPYTVVAINYSFYKCKIIQKNHNLPSGKDLYKNQCFCLINTHLRRLSILPNSKISTNFSNIIPWRDHSCKTRPWIPQVRNINSELKTTRTLLQLAINRTRIYRDSSWQYNRDRAATINFCITVLVWQPWSKHQC